MSTSATATRQQALASDGEHNKVSVVHTHRAAISHEDTLEERGHELRAALFGIEASAQGLHDHRDRMSYLQVDELTNALLSEVRRLRSLIDGRSEAAGMFDLGAVVAQVVACRRASGLDVCASVPRGIVVNGSLESTAQVLVALLDNARKHAPSSPVEIRTALHDDVVTLVVEDRGRGIDVCSPDRVLDRSISGKRGGGSGLGLFVARRLMTEQGGSITVRSRVGGGTSFVLRFRRAS